MGLITWLATKLGTRTPAPRPTVIRSIAAAGTGRLFSGWTTASASADGELRMTLKALRARSRDLAINNDYAARYIGMVEDNLVGACGVKLQSKVTTPRGKLDETANKKIESGWLAWGARGVCDVTGMMSWADCQQLAAVTWARDGEVLIRMHRNARLNRFAFALQFIEADQLDETYNTVLANGHQVRMGVEFDAMGRPVAYYIRSWHPGDTSFEKGGKYDLQRIPAREIIHLYRVERPGQSRGLPPMTRIMTRLNNIGGYEEAAIINARFGASKMGFYTRQLEAVGEYQGDDTQGNTPISAVEPGQLEALPPGWDFKSFDPAYPHGEFDEFMKRTLKGVASGLNVSYHRLANDLADVNFAAGRLGELAERDHWKKLQQFFISNFIDIVFGAWLEMALTTQAVMLPLEKYDYFRAPRWQARRWFNVDPMKEEQSRTEAYRNGRTSITRILAEQGEDIEDIIEERAAEEALARDKGVSLMVPAEEPVNGPDDDEDD